MSIARKTGRGLGVLVLAGSCVGVALAEPGWARAGLLFLAFAASRELLLDEIRE